MIDAIHATVRTEGGGVQWAPEPPSGWTQARIKDAADVINGFPFDSSLFTTDEGHPLIRIRDLGQTETSVYFAGEPGSAAWVHPGDVLIGMDGDFNVERWRGPDALLNQRMCCVRSRGDDDVRFVAYVLPFPLKVINDLTYSTTVKHLSSFQVAAIRFPRPPHSEQQRIADYLDSETARIDTLIDRKQRFIDLLLEKRGALITQAVTKGLDPAIQMKDSGLEWLGSIPATWHVMPLRRFIDSIEQGWSPVAEDRTADLEEWAVTKLSAVSRGAFRDSEHKALETGCEERPSLEVRPGDLLLTRSNTPDRVGDVALVEHTRPRLMICDLVYRLHVRGMDKSYLLYWLLSTTGRHQIVVDARGTSGSMVKIAQGAIKSWYLPVPPLEEQARIAQFLRVKTAGLDELVARTRKSVQLLGEYRTAVISAAVTGQIDIPGTDPTEEVA